MAFPYLLFGFILGLIIGITVGYVIPKKSVQLNANQPTQQQATTPSTSIPLPAPQGFYGTVISNTNNILSIQEILPTKQLGYRIFKVRGGNTTIYTYQKPTEDQKAPFIASTGKFENIKKDMFVFGLTSDNPATIGIITATNITYSEKSPF